MTEWIGRLMTPAPDRRHDPRRNRDDYQILIFSKRNHSNGV